MQAENELSTIEQTFQDRDYLPGWLRPWDERTSLSYHTVARALSRICRYGGRCPRWYSVARHSRLVSLLLPAEATPRQHLLALLHDGHEPEIGDILRPLESSLPDSSRRLIADKRRSIDVVLCELLGVHGVTDADREVVQIADDHACFLEIRLLDQGDTVIADALAGNPEAAYELSVVGRPELDAADWREAWAQWMGAAEAVAE